MSESIDYVIIINYTQSGQEEINKRSHLLIDNNIRLQAY